MKIRDKKEDSSVEDDNDKEDYQEANKQNSVKVTVTTKLKDDGKGVSALEARNPKHVA